MQDEDFCKKLKYLKHHFLCSAPLKDVRWQDFAGLNVDLQKEIIDSTVRSGLVLKFPLNIDYQKLFVKRLLEQLEGEGSAVDDSLYEEYARLVALPRSDINFKHYSLASDTKNITLQEDIHLVSGGTTGLRTWQASLALSEWILHNSANFDSKRVIELGSGVGLTGLVLALHCAPKSVCLTDCHPLVLKVLCDNIILNIQKGSYSIGEKRILNEQINSCAVSVVNLPWERISLNSCQDLGQVDLIIAADVVYDNSTFESLINAVNCLFTYCGAEKFILSCSERNSGTLKDFLTLLRNNYKVSDLEVPEQRNFLWEGEPPIRIFSVTPV